MESLVSMLVEEGVLEFGEFVLSSGRKSQYYIDMRKCIAKPKLYRVIVEEYVKLLKSLEFNIIAGIATGGLVWAAMISYRLGVPMVYVRTEKKEHGRKEVVEGPIEPDAIAVVIDDVATTGASIERTVLALWEKGAVVRDAVVAVDREEGARERLEGLGIKLHSILKAKHFLERA